MRHTKENWTLSTSSVEIFWKRCPNRSMRATLLRVFRCVFIRTSFSTLPCLPNQRRPYYCSRPKRVMSKEEEARSPAPNAEFVFHRKFQDLESERPVQNGKSSSIW